MAQDDTVTADPAERKPAPIAALDARTRALLAEFRPVVAAHVDDIIGEFLTFTTAWPELRRIAPRIDQSPEALKRFRTVQGRHLLDLLSGEFDEGYFARISRMGAAHERAGLEPRWYLGAYGHVLKRLVELAVEACGSDTQRLLALVGAINRVVELDMACAVAALEPTPRPRSAPPAPREGIAGLVEPAVLKPRRRRRRTA
jgi:hypothetical protein